MNDLEKSEEIVKQLFIDYPETREDDNLLYYKYVTICTVAGKYFERLFYDSNFRKKCNVVSYKSIERSARKIRAKFPELKPSKKVQEAKEKKEMEYFTYSQI